MADRFLIGAGGTWANASSNIWAANSGGAADGGIAAGDTAKLDGNSGTLTISGGASCVCAALNTTGYTDTATVTAATPALGVMTLAAGTFDGGAFAVAATGLTYTGGTWAGGGAWTVNGNISGANAGTVTFSGGVTQTGAARTISFGDASQASTTKLPTVTLASGASSKSTLAGDLVCKKVILGAGTVELAAETLDLRPESDTFWDESGVGTFTATTGRIWIIAATGSNLTLASDITCPGDLYISSRYNSTQTFTGTFNMQSGETLGLAESGSGAARGIIIIAGVTGSPNVVNGDVDVANNHADLRFGAGTYVINNMNRDSVQTDTGIPMNLGTARFTLSGTFDGTGMTVTHTTAIIDGGTVEDVTNSSSRPILHFNSAGESGNTGVISPSMSQWARRHRAA